MGPNNEILHQIEKRDKLLRRLSRRKDDPELRQGYNRARNKLVRDIESARAEYYCNVAEEHKNEPRKFWQHIKTTGRNSKREFNYRPRYKWRNMS